MSKFYLWILKKYLLITKVRKGETIVVALKEEFNAKQLEVISDTMAEILGDKVVFIGGVDQIIVA